MIPASRKTCDKPAIALTMGDPCGVGPEILAKAFAAAELYRHCSPLVIGDPLALQRAVDLLGTGQQIISLGNSSDLRELPDSIQVLCPGELTAADLVYGHPSAATCRSIVDYIQVAARLAMDGEVDAICTCPIHKANLHQHGFSFPGHTEFLQQLTQARNVVMMLAGPLLRVALATIHHALADVPGLLNQDRLHTVIRITAEALANDFALQTPRLAVAGLNPHAGEEGRFGAEESTVIAPVVQTFRGGPFLVSGPYAPDTVFLRAYRGEFDAVVAMYHDQGLIPIKLVHFHQAVNITLGLPVVRTSVDHGTAYELAGTGKADAGSLQAAIRAAIQMAHNRRRHAREPGWC